MTPKKSKKHTHNTILTKKQTGLILIALGVFLVTFIALFMYMRAIRIQTNASIIPVKETAAYVEIALQKDDPQYQAFFPLFGKLAFMQEGSIQKTFSEQFGKDLTQLQSLLASPIGILILQSLPDEPIFLGQTKNPEALLSFLSDGIFERIYNARLPYAYLYKSRERTIGFYGDFFLVSARQEAVEQMLDSQLLSAERLSANKAFSFTQNPDNKPVFARFFITNAVAKKYAMHIQFAFPDDIASIGGIVEIKNNALTFTMRSLRKKISAQPHSLNEADGKFTTVLLRFMPDDPQVIFGGTTISSLKNALCSNGIIVCTDSLKELETFISNEYAMSIHMRDNKPQMLLTAMLANLPNADLTQTLTEKLKTIASDLAPEIKTITLKDGSEGAEFVSNRESVTAAQIEGGVTKLATLSGTAKSWNIFFTTRTAATPGGSVLFISTSESLLREALQAEKKNFYMSAVYADIVREVLRGVQTVFFINRDTALRYRADIPTVLRTFDNFAISEKQDGASIGWFGILK